MIESTDFLVESWRVLQEYVPDKDKAKAGEHWIQILQDNGVEKETLEALAESDDILVGPVNDALEEEEIFPEDDEYEEDLED